MLRRLFGPLATQPPTVRVWAFTIFAAYVFWAVLLLALPFGLDDRINHEDMLALYVAGWVLTPLIAGVGTLAALHTTAPPPNALRLAFGSGARALLAYNVTTAATMTLMLATAASRTDLHKLYAPVVLAVVAVNALVMWRWGRREPDPWTAWGALLLAGVVTAGAAGAGLRAPLDIQRTVNGVPITLVAPEGRVLDTCRPVMWDVGLPEDWEDAYVQIGLSGLPVHRTADAGSFALCPLTRDESVGDPGRVLLTVPVSADGEVHRELLDLRVVDVAGMRTLWVLALVTALLPPVVVRWRAYPLLGVVVVAAGLAFGWRLLTPTAILWAAALTLPVLWLLARIDALSAPRNLRRVLDALTLLMIPLVTINIALPTDRYHVNFWLGPINDILQGKTLFVDASSQYGIGSQYALAAVFAATPLEPLYPGFGLIAYTLLALITAALYLILRRLTGSWALAALFVALVAVVFVWRSSLTVSSHPSNGPLRYLFQYVLLGLVALRGFDPKRARTWRGAEYVAAALAFIWSFEAWVFSWVPYIGLLVFEEVARGTTWGGSLRRLARHLGWITLGAGVVLGVFMVGGYVVSGSVPELGAYLLYIRAYAGASFTFVVFTPWAAALGLSYGTLAVVLFKLAFNPAGRADLWAYRIPVMVAMIGVMQFVYWVRVSLAESLATFVLPALFLGVYWLAQLERERLPGGVRRAGRALIAFAMLCVFVGHLTQPPISVPVQTPLQWAWNGYAPPLAPPQANPVVTDALALVADHSPDAERLGLFLSPDDTVEVLLRTGTAHIWRLSDPAMEVWSADTARWARAYTGYTPQVGDVYYVHPTRNVLQAQILAEITSQAETAVVATSGTGIEVWEVVALGAGDD